MEGSQNQHLDLAIWHKTFPAKRICELLSVVELAEYLGVPVSTIHYWRGKEGGPPGFKVGKQLRFRAADIVRWLEERARREAALPE
jgi:excisionase family DNA binding protein